MAALVAWDAPETLSKWLSGSCSRGPLRKLSGGSSGIVCMCVCVCVVLRVSCVVCRVSSVAWHVSCVAMRRRSWCVSRCLRVACRV
eukprot:10855082-Alexandrium_andersonii.AAC.1